jgi:DNA-binding SARP family transcriptional activator
LLGFLAAQRCQTVSRERLADLLWPFKKSEVARHSLRNCLLQLRRTFGPSGAGYIASDQVYCRIAGAVVDLHRFERLSRSQQRSELQAAADLYRGNFLADLDVNSEPFQEWLAREREHTFAVACDVLHKLTAAQDAAGNHDAAIQTGRRLVALDPLCELGQRALIRAYARAGRCSEALRQYKSCAQILERELGVAPDRETQRLANAIFNSSQAGRERSHRLIVRISRSSNLPHPMKRDNLSDCQRRGLPVAGRNKDRSNAN